MVWKKEDGDRSGRCTDCCDPVVAYGCLVLSSYLCSFHYSFRHWWYCLCDLRTPLWTNFSLSSLFYFILLFFLASYWNTRTQNALSIVDAWFIYMTDWKLEWCKSIVTYDTMFYFHYYKKTSILLFLKVKHRLTS